MGEIKMTLSELEGHFWCYKMTSASYGPSASAELLVLLCCIIIINAVLTTITLSVRANSGRISLR